MAARPSQKTKPKPTSLHFRIQEQISHVQFVGYLNKLLEKHKTKLTFKSSKWQFEGTVIVAEIQFDSLSQAKAALKIITKSGAGFEVSLRDFTTPTFKSQLDDFRQSIGERRHQLERSHCSKLTELQEKLGSLHIPKKCSPMQYETILQMQESVRERVQECSDQLTEFIWYCEELYKQIDHLQSSITQSKKGLERLKKMRKEFGLECGRFARALPIYARRREIISTIQDNQLSILIGETGSGKSTQLVQYLHYAGLADKGRIACTQPRKVAAVTLAGHVSHEMGVKVGNEVGYKVGDQGGRCSPSTKVFFMTDHALLNECIHDRNFTRYSCIVIDEAHERSLQTDILIAFVKQCLPRRPDLHVVITSATIDPKQFTDYFGKCPIIHVSGRAFPVEMIWNPLGSIDPPVSQPYEENAIEMATQIHAEEKDGDILVFLTGAAEIDRACQKMSKEVGNKALILPLHGKLQPQDQQKVFEPSQVRKIIFATNVAETSVTIPGVKYIVDTGLAKEMHFDSKRNMNSLTVCLISKSSAEQRKGRAGRTSAGKCYRLYSHEWHAQMPEKSAPEIMRVHLTHAALKLFQLGVGSILDFDFVEHPDREALTKAVETLEFIGAVENNTLTQLGQKMALFPIDPQLTKVLFLGIENDIGYESAVAVAMSSSGGGVFFRSEEVKEESDRKKLEFCHHSGDQMTHLNVYRKWLQQKKENRNKWCVENYINAKTMRLVEESIKEIRVIFQNSLNTSLQTRIVNWENAEKILPELFFDVYVRNLCIFLGHDRVGYMSGKLPGETLHIFPGSSLPKLNVAPTYLVYEKTLKTSQHFLLSVVPVKTEWVDKAIQSGKIMENPMEMLQQYLVTPLYLTKIGQQVFRNAIFSPKGQVEVVKEEIQTACRNQPMSFNCIREKGLIVIHANSAYHKPVRQVVDKRLNAARSKMLHQQFEWGVTEKNDDVRVVLGTGGSIRHVLMPYDYRTLIVKGYDDEQWLLSFLEHLKTYGEIDNHFQRKSGRSCICNVTFCSPQDAYVACTTLDNSGLPEGVTVQPQLRKGGGGSGTQFTLKIEWSRRARCNFAFMTFNRSEDYMIAASQLTRSPVTISGSLVKFRLSKDGKEQLFASNVGIHVTEESFRSAVDAHLQFFGLRLKYSVSFGYEKSFPTTKEQTSALSHQLTDLVVRRATRGRFTVDMKPPKPHFTLFQAFVKFDNPDEGSTVLDYLRDKDIQGKPLQVKPILESSITYPREVFNSISDAIDRAIENVNTICGRDVEVTISNSPKYPTVRVQIKSDEVDEFVKVKRILNRTLEPDVLQCLTPEFRQFVLRRQAQEDFKSISSSTSAYISFNRRLMVLNIYGTEGNRERAKIELNHKISQIVGKGMVFNDIQLKSYPPGVMKFLVTEFGHDLSGLAGKVGNSEIQDAILNVHRHTLSLLCTVQAHGVIKQCLEEYCNRVAPLVEGRGQVLLENRIPECCVCFSEIEDLTEVYRLEYCGHEYCLDCIQLQTEQNSIQIPLKCAAENCEQTFVWQDFETLFKKTKFKLEDLLRASVSSHIVANSATVKNCPTPDCDMIYVVTTDGKPFTCSHCRVKLCTSCHVQYHDGLTCAMYQSGYIPVDREVREWMNRDRESRKLCPCCRSPIEKTGGCNNMTCKNCKKHICWVCLEFFDTDQECYGHLHNKHGRFV